LNLQAVAVWVKGLGVNRPAYSFPPKRHPKGFKIGVTPQAAPAKADDT